MSKWERIREISASSDRFETPAERMLRHKLMAKFRGREQGRMENVDLIGTGIPGYFEYYEDECIRCPHCGEINALIDVTINEDDQGCYIECIRCDRVIDLEEQVPEGESSAVVTLRQQQQTEKENLMKTQQDKMKEIKAAEAKKRREAELADKIQAAKEQATAKITQATAAANKPVNKG